MTSAYEEVREQLRKSAEYNKRYYDISLREKKFDAGQWVWYHNACKLQGRQMKWVRQYEGPYLVLQMLSPLTAKIQLSARSRPKIVHVDKLKPYEGDPPKSWITDRTSQARGDPVEQDRTDPDLESSNEERTNPPASSTEPKESPCVDNSTPHSVEGSPRVEVETSNFGEEFERMSNAEFDMNLKEFESAMSGVN